MCVCLSPESVVSQAAMSKVVVSFYVKERKRENEGKGVSLLHLSQDLVRGSEKLTCQRSLQPLHGSVHSFLTLFLTLTPTHHPPLPPLCLFFISSSLLSLSFHSLFSTSHCFLTHFTLTPTREIFLRFFRSSVQPPSTLPTNLTAYIT